MYKIFIYFLSPAGTLSIRRRLIIINKKAKESNTMDGLGFDPSALLIVGMLIGVVYTLL